MDEGGHSAVAQLKGTERGAGKSNRTTGPNPRLRALNNAQIRTDAVLQNPRLGSWRDSTASAEKMTIGPIQQRCQQRWPHRLPGEALFLAVVTGQRGREVVGWYGERMGVNT